jgi:hypothetical protein
LQQCALQSRHVVLLCNDVALHRRNVALHHDNVAMQSHDVALHFDYATFPRNHAALHYHRKNRNLCSFPRHLAKNDQFPPAAAHKRAEAGRGAEELNKEDEFDGQENSVHGGIPGR